METVPVQIWEMIKWCGIVSCFSLWVLVLAKWGYKFFFEEDTDKK